MQKEGKRGRDLETLAHLVVQGARPYPTDYWLRRSEWRGAPIPYPENRRTFFFSNSCNSLDLYTQKNYIKCYTETHQEQHSFTTLTS